MEALRSGDPDAAAEAMHHHLAGAAELLRPAAEAEGVMRRIVDLSMPVHADMLTFPACLRRWLWAVWETHGSSPSG